MKCWWCSEEIVGYRNVVFAYVLNERVPFHQEFLRDCRNDYLRANLEAPLKPTEAT